MKIQRGQIVTMTALALSLLILCGASSAVSRNSLRCLHLSDKKALIDHSFGG